MAAMESQYASSFCSGVRSLKPGACTCTNPVSRIIFTRGDCFCSSGFDGVCLALAVGSAPNANAASDAINISRFMRAILSPNYAPWQYTPAAQTRVDGGLRGDLGGDRKANIPIAI